MTRARAFFGFLVIVGLLCGEAATSNPTSVREIIYHVILLVFLVFALLAYCGFATLHAVQHVSDPVERATWVLLTVGLNVGGSCFYYFTKYQSFRRVGKGGLLRKTGTRTRKFSELSEEEAGPGWPV
jgi:fumarate reductase subunit D